MMLVFSSVAMMNANTNSTINSNSAMDEFSVAPDCYDIATAWEAYTGGGYAAFSAAYDECCGC